MRPLALAAAIAVSLSSTQDPQPPVFRSGVDLVTVDAVVLDRDGRPVTDLTAADFIVTATKKRRKVISAEFVRVAEASAPAAVAAGVEAIPQASSNAARSEGRSFVIVVDVDGIQTGGGRTAMRGIADFVSTLHADDRVGVVALPSGRPRVDLTTNRGAVRTALESIAGASQGREALMTLGEAAAIEHRDKNVLADWLIRCEQQRGQRCDPADAPVIADTVMAQARYRSRNLLDALRALAVAMAPLQGLKTILLVSEGMLRDREVIGDLVRFGEAAAAARVMLYALVLDTPRTQSTDGMGPSPDRRLDTDLMTNGMSDAALAAGGEMFHISATPVHVLNRIDAQLTGYYLLSFESDPGDVGDKRRTLTVKVSRPNLTVHARPDFAMPARARPAPGAAPDLRARVGELVRWSVPIGEVPIEMATFAAAPASETARRTVIIAAELPPGVRPAAVGFEIFDERGTPVADSFDAAPEVTSVATATTYVSGATLGPGRYRLKCGVVLTDGRRGSIEHLFAIEPASSGQLRLSDILLGDEDAAGFRPLVRLPAGTAPIVVRVELQATAAEAFAGKSVVLDVVRQGETTPLASAAMQFETTDDPLKRMATAKLTPGTLAAGDYLLQARVQGSTERASRLVRKR
jgi:VWFA-related protein